jgi:hypothetical protein
MQPLNFQNQTILSGPVANLPAALPAREDPADLSKVSAWEMIENGRYRPRRIKGSLLGRDLG